MIKAEENELEKSKQRWALFFVVAALLIAWIFADSQYDLWAGKLFYHPENSKDPWFEQDHPLWLFFYHAAPWLTAIPLLGSLLIIVGSFFSERLKSLKIYAVYFFLVIALGPGLLINTVFKPNWGRPRPREVIELGGKYQYHPFYQIQWRGPGKSFPCGHCSVGFSFFALVFLWQGRRKKLAVAAGVFSVGLGFLMGFGRMAAGGHFLSDVLWAGWITGFVAFGLYYYILKIPQAEAKKDFSESISLSASEPRWLGWLGQKTPVTMAAIGLLGLLTLAAILLATPFEQKINLPISETSVTSSQNQSAGSVIQTLNFEIDQTSLDFYVDENLTEPWRLTGAVRGFGFPKNKIVSFCQKEEAREGIVLNCQISRVGLFSDFESLTELRIHPRFVQSLNLKIKKGDIFNRTPSMDFSHIKLEVGN